jgi:hypothetical protein
LAAAISAFMPPQDAADVTVDQFTPLPLPLPPEPLEPELLLAQPAMSTTLPTAAPAAAIAFFARKVTLPCRPRPGIRTRRTCHLG